MLKKKDKTDDKVGEGGSIQSNCVKSLNDSMEGESTCLRLSAVLLQDCHGDRCCIDVHGGSVAVLTDLDEVENVSGKTSFRSVGIEVNSRELKKGFASRA